ncbi:MAG: hypothetical protein EHM14_09755 [Methanothrix sp.]|nr:MAG: hypothetical protein EHM14_09755 [Methanothrix sp.]
MHKKTLKPDINRHASASGSVRSHQVRGQKEAYDLQKRLGNQNMQRIFGVKTQTGNDQMRISMHTSRNHPFVQRKTENVSQLAHDCLELVHLYLTTLGEEAKCLCGDLSPMMSQALHALKNPASSTIIYKLIIANCHVYDNLPLADKCYHLQKLCLEQIEKDSGRLLGTDENPVSEWARNELVAVKKQEDEFEKSNPYVEPMSPELTLIKFWMDKNMPTHPPY